VLKNFRNGEAQLRTGSDQSTIVLRYGSYICLSVPDDVRDSVAALPVPRLADRHGFLNEFDNPANHLATSIAFLRCVGATPGDIPDSGLLRAGIVIHVASPRRELVTEFCAELTRLIDPTVGVRILDGGVRPRTYTSAAMFEFAYAHQVVQQQGKAMPHAFLIPMSKTEEWWRKDWMERQSYFLPTYAETGEMLSQGHALAAAAGIPCIMRRFYRGDVAADADGTYDFITYFECADKALPVFHDVRAALQDKLRNPEWKFVREGPTWRGKRVRTWSALLD
jgi:hypothetical protein